MDTTKKYIQSIDPVIYAIFFVMVIAIIISLTQQYRSGGCCRPMLDVDKDVDNDVDNDGNDTENFGGISMNNEEKKYNRIILKDTKFYFLTVDNADRKSVV